MTVYVASKQSFRRTSAQAAKAPRATGLKSQPRAQLALAGGLTISISTFWVVEVSKQGCPQHPPASMEALHQPSSSPGNLPI